MAKTRSITVVGVEGHPNTQRVTFDSFMSHKGQQAVSNLQITVKGQPPVNMPMTFGDVCNLRTLLEDLQAAHSDAAVALEAADLEG